MKKSIVFIVVALSLVSSYLFLKGEGTLLEENEDLKKPSIDKQSSLPISKTTLDSPPKSVVLENKRKKTSKKVSISQKIFLLNDMDNIDPIALINNPETDLNKTMSEVIKRIKSDTKCILNNTCKGYNTKHPYNDPNNTNVQRRLNLEVDLYSLLLNKNLGPSEKLNFSDLSKLIKISNYAIRFSALSILVKQEGVSSIKTTFNAAKSFKGSDAADYISFISSKSILKEYSIRSERNKIINHYLKNSSDNTVSTLVKSLYDIPLKENGVKIILASFCARKVSRDTDAGKMLLFKYKKLASKYEIQMPCN